jgi:hypothetical protein
MEFGKDRRRGLRFESLIRYTYLVASRTSTVVMSISMPVVSPIVGLRPRETM